MADDDAQQRLAMECAAAMWATDRASQAMGMKVESVATGKASIVMTVRQDMIGPGGLCSRGVIFMLADSALAFAANTRGHRVVAQHCEIAFDNAVRAGEQLVAHAHERHVSDRKGIYDVRVQTRAGMVVAELRGHSHTLAEPLVEQARQGKP
jgi:acyl-CoA thioesterase